MSDVRLKLLAGIVIVGLAPFMALTAGVEPAEAGIKLRKVAGAAATSSARQTNRDQHTQVAQADDGQTGDSASDQPDQSNSDTAPQGTSSDSQEAATPADTSSENAAKPATAAQAAPVPVAPPMPAAKAAANEKPLPAAGPDYYTERAKKAVAEDGKEEAKQHPLQAANPDHNVIVCEGGCSGQNSAQIVSIEPRAAHKPIALGEMIPSSSDGAAKKEADTTITCEAGCYDNAKRSYANIPGGGFAGAKAGMADGGSWVTTVTSAAAASGSKPAKMTASKSNHEGGSGDWMKRINKEMRQSANAPAPTAASAGVPAKAAAEKTVVAVEAADKPAAMAEARPETKSEAKMAAAEPLAVPTATAPAAAPEAPAATSVAGKMTTTAGELAPAAPAVATADTPKETPASAAASAAPLAPVVPAQQLTAAASSAPAVEATKELEVVAEKQPALAPEQKASGEPAKAPPATPASASNEPSTVESAAPATAPAVVVAAAPVEPMSPAEPVSPAEPISKPVVTVESAPPAAEKPADADKTIEAVKPVEVAEAAAAEVSKEQPAPPAVAGSQHDPVVNIETADSEMASAMSKARASLPEFWSKLEQPGSGETDFSLKVAISGSNEKDVEHFWLTGIKRKDGVITGTISNEPSTVKTVHMGQLYTIDQAKISDWMFKRNGKMVGNETMRPLLKRLPAQQAADYQQMYEKP